MESVMETSLRTVIGFVFLLALTRILGKKQLGQLTYFTYITGIAMGKKDTRGRSLSVNFFCYYAT